MIDAQKLMDFFAAEFAEEQEADEIKKGISDDMKSYAENIEVSPKAIKSAYALYKKYKSGKHTAADCEDYSQMSGIIENFFATGEDED